MAQPTLIVGFLVGAAIVATIVVLSTRGRYRYAPSPERDSGQSAGLLARAMRSPAVWIASFVGLTLLAGVATVLAVGGFGVSAGIAADAGVLLAAVGGLVLVAYVFYGTVAAARARGLHSAQAVAFGSWAVGLLVLVAVAVSLLGYA
jgi:hypothetical protein